MIVEIKKNEAMYFKNLKERFQENFSSFDDRKSLEHELNGIEETFRNPNLLIESIRDMQQKQEESLNDIQIKLNQMSKIKDNLKATNEFKSNSTSFNQNDTSLFGSVKLNEFCSYMNSLQSQILNGDRQSVELIKLCEFSPNDNWSLLYRGTRDGYRAVDFHSKCDGH